MRRIDLVVMGHIMIERILIHNQVIGPVLGSPAAYSSVAASSLGLNTGLVTKIGKDMPYFIVQPILESGVGTEGIRIQGENSRETQLVYDKNGNKTVTYDKVAEAIVFEDIPAVYLDASAFFVCPMDFEVTLETVSRLRDSGKMTMTDLGGFGGTVSTMHPCDRTERSRKMVMDIVNCFHIVKASEEDCKFLFPEPATHKEAIQSLHKWGAAIVLLTLGVKGSIASDGKKALNIPAFQTETVDTTGAGDVYCAAFLANYLKTERLYESGVYASAAASILTEKSGGVTCSRMPAEQRVQRIIADSIQNVEKGDIGSEVT